MTEKSLHRHLACKNARRTGHAGGSSPGGTEEHHEQENQEHLFHLILRGHIVYPFCGNAIEQ